LKELLTNSLVDEFLDRDRNKEFRKRKRKCMKKKAREKKPTRLNDEGNDNISDDDGLIGDDS